jgi:hypothetical protein
MKRAIFALCLVLVLVGAPSASAAVGDQLLFNRGLEAGTDRANTAPAGWSPSWWATDQINRSTFTWSTDAHTGMRSARVDVNGYTGGDSKWVPDPAPVNGGTYYTFSDWYRSNRSSAVSVYYELAADTDADGDGLINGHWSNLFSGIAPASEWTQYKTGFTMPAGAVSAQFVHFIAGNGRLETDDYSLTEEAAPPGFSKPIISLTFDDGSRGFWDNARDTLKAKGFETTQYIPTLGLTNPDPSMMTRNEIMTLAKEGNEIGGHSTTHPLLTTVTDAELDDELVASKNVLETISGVGTVRNFAYPFGDYDARVIAAGRRRATAPVAPWRRDTTPRSTSSCSTSAFRTSRATRPWPSSSRGSATPRPTTTGSSSSTTMSSPTSRPGARTPRPTPIRAWLTSTRRSATSRFSWTSSRQRTLTRTS